MIRLTTNSLALCFVRYWIPRKERLRARWTVGVHRVGKIYGGRFPPYM